MMLSHHYHFIFIKLRKTAGFPVRSRKVPHIQSFVNLISKPERNHRRIGSVALEGCRNTGHGIIQRLDGRSLGD